jgi:hypothetical protein
VVGSSVLRFRQSFTARCYRVLLLAPEGGRHEIGLHVASDLLYGTGYDTFEVAAGWGASVCADVSNAVESVDALTHRAPLN